MQKNSSRGFTLIELLVVIAIIGILSAVVLASLSTARNKGNDAKIQTQIQSFQTAAEVYYSTNSNYGSGNGAGNNICSLTSTDTTGLYNLMQGANYPGGAAPTCNTDSSGAAVAATKYAVWHTLSADTTKLWCADSTGVSKQLTTSPSSGATNC